MNRFIQKRYSYDVLINYKKSRKFMKGMPYNPIIFNNITLIKVPSVSKNPIS